MLYPSQSPINDEKPTEVYKTITGIWKTRPRQKKEEGKEESKDDSKSSIEKAQRAYSFSVTERDSPLNRTSVGPKWKKKAKSKPKKNLKDIDEGPEINIKWVQASTNFTKSLYD